MVEITGAGKEVFARHRLKLTDSGMMSFSLPQFLLLCALIDFSPMLDDGYDAQLSVGMSTIYRRVVSSLWDCLSMGLGGYGLRACGVGVLRKGVSFNYYDLFFINLEVARMYFAAQSYHFSLPIFTSD